jgi:hypothetical protein
LRGFVEITKLLLDYAQNYALDGVLFEALRNEKREISNILINHPKGVFIGRQRDNAESLKWAGRYGYTEIVQILLQQGKEGVIVPNDAKRFNISFGIQECFQWGCREGRVEIVQIILNDKRFLPNARDNPTPFYASWHSGIGLEWAVEYNQPKIIELLLKDKRVDPSFKNCYWIRYAAKKGYKKIVKLIYEGGRGIPKNIQPNSRLRKLLNKL